ncbi:hypothetical protein [Paenibacillus sp. J2TS4]|uniref:hypothetical protein n=1 Tax=Paenibacillus sp. J2TS4 TaxID=2807194 RepID=UPI001AFE79ED|nr:hypothetical protein [Paenibacillus sp. J2TS4]GIP31703.1 hypothetical protein J2TS4_09130 [Paenibacillus sp. J2TS4]
MSSKRIVIVCTMAAAIAIGIVWNDEKSAAACVDKYKILSKIAGSGRTLQDAAGQDPLLHALGATSDEELYDALYEGKSLADIAAANEAEVQNVIDLQVAELTEQLDMRLAGGSLSLDAYLAHKSEVAEVIARSVYGGNVPSGSA